MKIEATSFGSMTVAGREYRKDLLLLPDRVVPGWWRKSGHLLTLDDLGEVLAYAPEIVVVGTGVFGAMKVLPEVAAAFTAREIDLNVHRTGKAAARFNELRDRGRKVAGAFHLTC